MNAEAPLLFLHGGPGINSRAEEVFFKEALIESGLDPVFWNAPSSPNLGFSRSMHSALEAAKVLRGTSGRIHLVAHSFAVHLALRMTSLYPELFSKLTLIAPAPDQSEIFNVLVPIAAADYEKAGSPNAETLRARRSESSRFFDSAMRDGFQLILTDPTLLLNYFKNTEALHSVVELWTKEKLSIDLEMFFSVMDELSSLGDSVTPLPSVPNLPVQVIWGRHDPVCGGSVQMQVIQKLLPQAEHHFFENSAHFPHLEEPAGFLRQLKFGFLSFVTRREYLEELEDGVRIF